MKILYNLYGFYFSSDFPLLGYSPVKTLPSSLENIVRIFWTEVESIDSSYFTDNRIINDNGFLKVHASDEGIILSNEEICINISVLKKTIHTYSAAEHFCEMNLILKNTGMATWLYLNGKIPLHASSVKFDNTVIGVSAKSGVGKSTFSLAMVSRTAGIFFGDDILALEINSSGISLLPAPSANPKIDVGTLLHLEIPVERVTGFSHAYGGSELYVELDEGKKERNQSKLFTMFFAERSVNNVVPIVKYTDSEQYVTRLVSALHSAWVMDGKEKTKVLFRLRQLSSSVRMYDLMLPDRLDELPQAIQMIIERIAEKTIKELASYDLLEN